MSYLGKRQEVALYKRLSSANKDFAKKMRRGGHGLRISRYPATIIVEAQHAQIPLSLACALASQETGGGINEFGHDPTIFIGAGEVTWLKYHRYKLRRGHTRMQGVGPLQLTWWATQDAADRLGGCYVPRWNFRVGYVDLAGLMREFGHRDGIMRYNGSGAAAEKYAREVQEKADHWHNLLT